MNSKTFISAGLLVLVVTFVNYTLMGTVITAVDPGSPAYIVNKLSAIVNILLAISLILVAIYFKKDVE